MIKRFLRGCTALVVATSAFTAVPAHAVTGPAFTISMSADKSQALPNDIITYAVTFSNTGDLPAEEYTMESHLPLQTTEAPMNQCPPNYTCQSTAVATPGQGDSFWQVSHSDGPLNPGDTVTVLFAVQVNSNASVGSVLNNQARIALSGTTNVSAIYSNFVYTTVVGPTTLTNTGATSGAYGKSASVAARLTDSSGAGIASRSITFSLGSQSCAASTNASGTAACTITLAQLAGSYTLTGSFAGDSSYAASSYSVPFTITGGTSLALNNQASAKAGSSVQLKATLLYNGNPISGASVTLTLGSASCHASTNASGVVQCGVVAPATPGTYPTGGSYAGSGTYPAATAPAGSMLITS